MSFSILNKFVLLEMFLYVY